MDGLPHWSPCQVLATIYCVGSVCVCVRVCVRVRVYLCLLGISYHGRLERRNLGTFRQLSPQTIQTTLNSCNVTQTVSRP